MIAIVDYGLGNVKAFANAYKSLNIPANIITRAQDLKTASKVILPGVGAFDHAMRLLERSGMRQSLEEMVLQRHVPILGVCVGMQILACSSEEGSLPGLSWVDAIIKRMNFVAEKNSVCIPHMGWNNIRPLQTNGLLKGFDPDARFYFLHSYYFESNRKEIVVAVTDYQGEFASVVNSGNVYGVQFHPEKSHQWGTRLLKNFAEL